MSSGGALGLTFWGRGGRRRRSAPLPGTGETGRQSCHGTGHRSRSGHPASLAVAPSRRSALFRGAAEAGAPSPCGFFPGRSGKGRPQWRIGHDRDRKRRIGGMRQRHPQGCMDLRAMKNGRVTTGCKAICRLHAMHKCQRIAGIYLGSFLENISWLFKVDHLSLTMGTSQRNVIFLAKLTFSFDDRHMLMSPLYSDMSRLLSPVSF